jgi:hypothetical protein
MLDAFYNSYPRLENATCSVSSSHVSEKQDEKGARQQRASIQDV